jgi:DNA adenine methylase
MADPVVKGAGGKRQILDKIRGCLPPESEINRYHEPFFGGGALFFRTAPHGPNSSINDINTRLMSCYRVIRDSPDELIEQLQNFRPPGDSPDDSREFAQENRKGKEITEYYYQQRELFNCRPYGEEYDQIEEAALLLYLNRTCYNGLYRENKSGGFNVPVGDKSNRDWVQEPRVRKASEVLQEVEILDGDFGYVENYASAGDLVYFDPPYEPVSETSSFVEYSSEAFSTDEQERLRDLANRLDNNGVHVVISNSPPMRELYRSSQASSFDVVTVGAKRMINSNADDRDEVNEIIITNVDEADRRTQEPTLSKYS